MPSTAIMKFTQVYGFWMGTGWLPPEMPTAWLPITVVGLVT